jgi:hypothetical protein
LTFAKLLLPSFSILSILFFNAAHLYAPAKHKKDRTDMTTDWIQQELCTADLDDERLNKRFAEVLRSLSRHPNVSIPAASNGYAEIMAAYRFFSNPKVTLDKILEPHRHATKERMSEQEVVLCIQDSTELDMTRPKQQIRGLGPIGSGDRRGAFLHLLSAFTPDCTPLGTLWHNYYTRPDETPEEKALKKKNRPKMPINEKESYRWLQGYQQTIQVAKENPNTTYICVGDSECDIFEVLAEPRVANAHLLVRACKDRHIQDEDGEASRIRTAAYAAPIIATKVLQVRPRPAAVPHATGKRDKARKAREAYLEIRKTTMQLQVPELLSKGQYEPISVNVILVSEASPPPGEEAIEWILLTTLPIDTLEEVLRVIEYYECRWMIEIFFKTLKSGCKVEGLQFEDTSRFEPCLGIYLMIAWRVLFVCRLGRSHPDWSCEILFDESEWKSVF